MSRNGRGAHKYFEFVPAPHVGSKVGLDWWMTCHSLQHEFVHTKKPFSSTNSFHSLCTDGLKRISLRVFFITRGSAYSATFILLDTLRLCNIISCPILLVIKIATLFATKVVISFVHNLSGSCNSYLTAVFAIVIIVDKHFLIVFPRFFCIEIQCGQLFAGFLVPWFNE